MGGTFMDNKMIDCNKCKNINLTEKQQNELGTKEPHICKIYIRRCFHLGEKTIIFPCL
jgi:predicted nucleic-acid-binding Zn-ribbon protein